MKVRDLRSGMKFTHPVLGDGIYIAQCQHPIRLNFELVIWLLSDGTYSFDCLLAEQELPTELVDEKPEVREQNFWQAINAT